MDPSVRLVVQHPDFSPTHSSLRLGSLSEATSHEVMLSPRRPGTVVFGQVTNGSSELVTQARVVILGTSTRIKTDHQGRYRLESHKSDSMDLFVTHPLYRPTVQEVTFSSEERTIQVDIRLENSKAMRGRIVDELGLPVVGASVIIEQVDGKDLYGNGGWLPSNDRGHFTIPNAPSHGDFRLAIWGDGLQTTKYIVDWGRKDHLITVRRSGRVYGQVIDAVTKTPVYRFLIPELDDLTFTSEKGHFDSGDGKHKRPLPSQLTLTVIADGYDPLTIDSVPAQSISEDPERMIYRLQPNAKRASIYIGRVLDENGSPIQKAEIGLGTLQVRNAKKIFQWALTDPSGTFQLSGINPAEQIFFVRAQNYAPTYGVTSDLVLETPGLLADITLVPAAEVFGHAWDENGNAISHTQVISHPMVRTEEAHDLLSSFSVLWPDTETDEHGYYRLQNLPVGEVQVQLLFRDSRRVAPKKTTLIPGASVELNFGDEGGLVVSGIVREGPLPLERVTVQLKPMDSTLRSQNAKTDSAGYFKMIHVPAGKYLFATLRPRTAENQRLSDPNDQSHILYKMMDIEEDSDVTVDYEARTIH